MIEPNHPNISITRQCELVGLHRATYYYNPAEIDDYTLLLMREIDEEFTRRPTTGTRTMTTYLKNKKYSVNRKRIQNLYHCMVLEAIYPKKNLSRKNSEHKIYPYLLRNVRAAFPNHIWSTDITYIRMENGFLYLMAILDWYSRYVLDWELSNNLESDFCIDALKRTLEHNNHCKIFNTDQGSQFTTTKFTDILATNGISISMDGKGRALDNVFVERLWRSVKYEKIYLHEFYTVQQVHDALEEYFMYYNNCRPHQGLNNEIPKNVYYAN